MYLLSTAFLERVLILRGMMGKASIPAFLWVWVCVGHFSSSFPERRKTGKNFCDVFQNSVQTSRGIRYATCFSNQRIIEELHQRYSKIRSSVPAKLFHSSKQNPTQTKPVYFVCHNKQNFPHRSKNINRWYFICLTAIEARD